MIAYTKDPDAVKDYGWDWSDFLVTDTIATSTWSKDATDSDLTIDSDTSTTTIATVILSGGTPGLVSVVTNNIVSAAGLIDDRSFYIRIVEQ